MNKRGQFMPMPLFIPRGEEEESKCPKCKRKEDIKEVCKHCGYVYKESEESYPLWWLCILIDIGLLFFCFFIFGKIMDSSLDIWLSFPLFLITGFLFIFLGICVWVWLSKEKKDDKQKS